MSAHPNDHALAIYNGCYTYAISQRSSTHTIQATSQFLVPTARPLDFLNVRMKLAIVLHESHGNQGTLTCIEPITSHNNYCGYRINFDTAALIVWRSGSQEGEHGIEGQTCQELGGGIVPEIDTEHTLCNQGIDYSGAIGNQSSAWRLSLPAHHKAAAEQCRSSANMNLEIPLHASPIFSRREQEDLHDPAWSVNAVHSGHRMLRIHHTE